MLFVPLCFFVFLLRVVGRFSGVEVQVSAASFSRVKQLDGA